MRYYESPGKKGTYQSKRVGEVLLRESWRGQVGVHQAETGRPWAGRKIILVKWSNKKQQ